MNYNLVDKAFKDLISQREIYKKLGVSPEQVRKYRYNLANGINISTDKKIEWLKKSGWTGEEETFTRKDLISLLNFYKRTSQAARDHGPEHVIEKWELTRKKK